MYLQATKTCQQTDVLLKIFRNRKGLYNVHNPFAFYVTMKY